MSDETTEGVKAEIEPEFCIGSSVCVNAAPHLFHLNSEGLAEWSGHDGRASRAELEAIAGSCPQMAITIVRATGDDSP
jgi:ferredoxin